LQEIEQTETILAESLGAESTPAEAARNVTLAIANDKRPHAASINWSWVSVAAAVCLVAGFLAGALVVTSDLRLLRMGQSVVKGLRAQNLEGMVLVRHAGSDIWETFETGQKICVGDEFHTGAKAGMLLEMEEGMVELKENSTLALKVFNGGRQLYLQHGRLRAQLETGHPRFFVHTPQGAVEALGTEFTVKVE
jgi:ferric-dicitrate binding protein FerR (iron transport regulator)